MAQFTTVGRSIRRVEGVEKVTGKARFTGDLDFPGLLEGRVLRSPFPHALIESIDVRDAEALPGCMACSPGNPSRTSIPTTATACGTGRSSPRTGCATSASRWWRWRRRTATSRRRRCPWCACATGSFRWRPPWTRRWHRRRRCCTMPTPWPANTTSWPLWRRSCRGTSATTSGSSQATLRRRSRRRTRSSRTPSSSR